MLDFLGFTPSSSLPPLCLSLPLSLALCFRVFIILYDYILIQGQIDYFHECRLILVICSNVCTFQKYVTYISDEILTAVFMKGVRQN